jgi:hypothetical protein
MGLLCLLVTFLQPMGASRDTQNPIDLVLDTTEAEAVLLVLEKTAAGQPVREADWRRIFTSEPYVRLKARETFMHREFTDEDFRRFVLSGATVARAPELRRTLGAWKRADLPAAAGRILPYLPATARIRAKVYPVIKPQQNSFVFEAGSNPAIFLYLDPAQSESAFENTVAHELHHIGLASLDSQYEARIRSLPEAARSAAKWMGAFGEGLAVLAAAGSTGVHPLAAFPADDRARWDQDMKFVDRTIDQLDQFFRDAVGGGFAKAEVADHVAFTFFGYRGPWYTVGYRMGAVVENRYGRAALLECMADPRLLLTRYNQVAAEQNLTGNDKRALWSVEVLSAVGIQ